MATLHSRCVHSLFSFFPRLFSAVGDWMSSANLECMCEMCCMWLAEIQDAKKNQKFAICVALHNFIGLYLKGMYRQSEKRTC